MIVCQGKFVPNCTGIANSLVDFGGIGTDGMPEPGGQMELCSPCATDFIKRNPEAVRLPLNESTVSSGSREIKS